MYLLKYIIITILDSDCLVSDNTLRINDNIKNSYFLLIKKNYHLNSKSTMYKTLSYKFFVKKFQRHHFFIILKQCRKKIIIYIIMCTDIIAIFVGLKR